MNSSIRYPNRLFLITLCIGGASIFAWLAKPSVISKPHPKPVVAISSGQILDGLPAVDATLPISKPFKLSVSKTRSFPNLASNWVELGEYLAQLQRDSGDATYYDYSESVYREALRLDPNNVTAMTGMAWVTGGRHRFDESVEWANQALSKNPDCTAAFGILGDAALELGDYDAAFSNYQKMTDLHPDLSSWSRGAHLLWITGKTNHAITLMGQAIRAGAPYAENTAWCRARLALMHFNQGALLPAQQAIQPSLDSGSKNFHVLLIAARIAAAKQDYDHASTIYHKMLEIRPNLEALAGLGDLMFVQNKPEEAEKFYLQVEALHAANLKSGTHDHGFMTRFNADRDRNLPEALRMAEEHKLTQNVLEADTLAWVYYKCHLMPQAIDAMKRALAQNTPDPEIHYHAGLIAKAYGDFPSSRKHLEQAIALNPNFSLLQAPRASQELSAPLTSKQVANP